MYDLENGILFDAVHLEERNKVGSTTADVLAESIDQGILTKYTL